jgi:hypothetical protein
MPKPAPVYDLDLVLHPEHDTSYVFFKNGTTNPFTANPGMRPDRCPAAAAVDPTLLRGADRHAARAARHHRRADSDTRERADLPARSHAEGVRDLDVERLRGARVMPSACRRLRPAR